MPPSAGPRTCSPYTRTGAVHIPIFPPFRIAGAEEEGLLVVYIGYEGIAFTFHLRPMRLKLSRSTSEACGKS